MFATLLLLQFDENTAFSIYQRPRMINLWRIYHRYPTFHRNSSDVIGNRKKVVCFEFVFLHTAYIIEDFLGIYLQPKDSAKKCFFQLQLLS
jgi:hypothetical protein